MYGEFYNDFVDLQQLLCSRFLSKPIVNYLKASLLIFVPCSPVLRQYRMASNRVECQSLISFPLEKEGLPVSLQHWSKENKNANQLVHLVTMLKATELSHKQ